MGGGGGGGDLSGETTAHLGYFFLIDKRRDISVCGRGERNEMFV